MVTESTVPQSGGEKFPRKSVEVQAGKTELESARNMAALATSPELAAYRVIEGAERNSGIGDHIDVPTLMARLRDEATEVNGGNLARAEAMLMNQATALQSLYSRLADRAMRCDGAVPFECNMRMALRAQSQCRATLETLAAIKNPPVVFARQANIANGPQQVNNVPPPSRAGENEFPPNQLLADGSCAVLPDARALALSGPVDQATELARTVNQCEGGSK